MNNFIVMHKVQAESAPAVLLSKFPKTAHKYLTNFPKMNYIKATYQLSRFKCRIFVRGLALWSEFLTDSEKEIENLSLFKNI